MSTRKTAAPATKAKPAAAAKPKAAAPAKPKAPTKPKAPAKAAKPEAKAAARLSGREATLARVESVRLAQRSEGHFDCFGRAQAGFCDQGGCAYHAECLSISRMLHEV